MAKNIVVVGTQWGDEGKGKIVDWLTDNAGGVVRFQGGHNAGHTLVIGEKEYKLNLVPSGIVRDGVHCYIGNGVVLDVHHLLSEIATLEADGLKVRGRVTISPGCPVILPYHSALDRAREAKRCSDTKIGTTGKGIGPTYEDKVARRALRVYDLFHPETLSAKLKEVLEYHNFVLTQYLDAEPLDHATILAQALADAEQIKPMVGDVSAALYAANKAGQNLLFEGAQGTLLDIDHGTYPFVTSSNCVAGQASAGTGVGPGMLHYILGITKAYTTRVGGGPFPTELNDEVGKHLATRGHEFGAVTGMPEILGLLPLGLAQRVQASPGLSGWLATRAGLSYLRIDPLKVDVGKVADTMSAAYAERHKVLPVQVSPTEVVVADPIAIE